MTKIDKDIAMVSGPPKDINNTQKVGTLIGVCGLIILVLAAFNVNLPNKGLWLTLSLLSIATGIIVFSKGAYGHKQEGIKNDGVWFKSMSSRGYLAWVAGIVLTGFYILLYFFPAYLGLNSSENTGIIGLFDPLSFALKGQPASEWFVYGTLYTVAIIAFGIKFIWKYRHNRYERIRTISVMFFQTAFAFLIPELMARLNSDDFSLPYNDMKNMWPLNYYAFDGWRVNEFINAQNIGLAFLILTVLMVFVISPFLTYKYGKRWYCSWVCGCGGLAETAGDPFRQLSDKSVKAWKFERWMVHSVLVFAVVMTAAVVSTYLGYDSERYWITKSQFLLYSGLFLSALFAGLIYYKRKELNGTALLGSGISYGITIAFLLVLAFVDLSQVQIDAAYFSFGLNDKKYAFDSSLRSFYGFGIGSIFSGVIGTGFYPILGNRAWCRFGCPMAAIMGLQQRFFSKFRITTNGGQCISCGNCSTYCEMGIDVKAYAQKGQNIVRASCVGCGVCSAVCPRGVLKLENGDDTGDSRYDVDPITFGNDGVKLNF